MKTAVFATIYPVGRDEYAAAGERGMKARYKFEVWANEYKEQAEILLDGTRLAVYRTYGPKEDDKIEIYAGERVGNR